MMKLKIIQNIFLKILLSLFLLNCTLMAETSKELIFSLDEKKFLEAKLQKENFKLQEAFYLRRLRILHIL